MLLRDCRIETAGSAGVLATDRSRAEVRHCTVANPVKSGFVTRDEAALLVVGGSVSQVAGNGVYAIDSSRLELDGCCLNATGYSAVHLAGRADGKLADCRIRGSAEYGIRVTGDALLRATALPSRSSRARCTAEHRWAAAASSPATCASPARGRRACWPRKAARCRPVAATFAAPAAAAWSSEPGRLLS